MSVIVIINILVRMAEVLEECVPKNRIKRIFLNRVMIQEKKNISVIML